MKYTGLHQQIQRNNTNSFLLLIAFPALLLGMFYIIIYFIAKDNLSEYPDENYPISTDHNTMFLSVVPFILIGVGIWFLIAWAGHAAFIRLATGAKPLERKENKRVYNLVENLCISKGMKMPNVNIIEDDSLNAFASGIDERSYTVTLSRGIINKLDDEELEGVIAHELSHIRNRDVRVLIISIIFVGIFAFLAECSFQRGFQLLDRQTNQAADQASSTNICAAAPQRLLKLGNARIVECHFENARPRFGNATRHRTS